MWLSLIGVPLSTTWPLRDCSAVVPVPHGTDKDIKDVDAQAASSRMASIVMHKSLHQKAGRFWGQREPFFLSHIPNASIVLDIGAGSMHLRTALADAGRSGVRYVPVDAVHRGHPHMRLCNLNKHEYPLSVSPAPTILVIQGVLEYIYDKLLFLRAMRCAYPRAKLLLSYAVGHRVGAFKMQGWVAPLLQEQLNEVFAVLSLNVTHRLPNCFPDQLCMRVVSSVPRSPLDVCAGFGRARHQGSMSSAGQRLNDTLAAGGGAHARRQHDATMGSSRLAHAKIRVSS